MYRKNKALEQRIELLEQEMRSTPLASLLSERDLQVSKHERAEFQIILDGLYKDLKVMEDKYHSLLTVRAEEIEQSK